MPWWHIFGSLNSDFRFTTDSLQLSIESYKACMRHQSFQLWCMTCETWGGNMCLMPLYPELIHSAWRTLLPSCSVFCTSGQTRRLAWFVSKSKSACHSTCSLQVMKYSLLSCKVIKKMIALKSMLPCRWLHPCCFLPHDQSMQPIRSPLHFFHRLQLLAYQVWHLPTRS